MKSFSSAGLEQLNAKETDERDVYIKFEMTRI